MPSEFTFATFTWFAAPAEMRITASVTLAELLEGMTTPSAPAHSATLIIEPRLCTSSIPSQIITKPLPCSAEEIISSSAQYL